MRTDEQIFLDAEQIVQKLRRLCVPHSGFTNQQEIVVAVMQTGLSLGPEGK